MISIQIIGYIEKVKSMAKFFRILKELELIRDSKNKFMKKFSILKKLIRIYKVKCTNMSKL
jgi:hypothetical protein